MSVTQRVFLHQRADTPEIIADYLKNSREEDEQLDFKAVAWQKNDKKKIPWIEGETTTPPLPPSLEAAKDVAAFANHLGGDIIVGVSDKNDRAAGWNPIPNADVTDKISNIRDWLIIHLRPQSFAGNVNIIPIAAEKPDHCVIVVSIPPSHDLIGVEYRDSDKLFFQYPIRVDKRTVWLTYEEVMNRATVTTRVVYIKLRQLISNFPEGAAPFVGFCSLVLNYGGSGGAGRPMRGNTGIHGKLIDISENTITVNMFNNEGSNLQSDNRITIPLELIKAVWLDRTPTQAKEQFLAFVIDANLVWNSQYWYLIAGNPRGFQQ